MSHISALTTSTTAQSDGIMAVAAGLQDGGLSLSFAYSGFLVRDLHQALDNGSYAPSARTALSGAYGASLAGKRALAIVGGADLVATGDILVHAMTTGVRAGLVCVVIDDVTGRPLAETHDPRWLMDFYGGLWFEPATLQDAYECAYQAFMLSERFDVPVGVRLTNVFFDQSGTIERREPVAAGVYGSIADRLDKYVVHPANFRKHATALRAARRSIETYCEEQLPAVEVERPNGVVVVGAAEASAQPDEDVLIIQAYPVPRYALDAFVRTHEQVRVAEVGADYVQRTLREHAGSANLAAAPPRRQHNRGRHDTEPTPEHKLLQTLRQVVAADVIMADTDLTVADEQCAVQVTPVHGSSLGVAWGYLAARPKDKVIVILPEAAILNEGVTALHMAAARNNHLTVILPDGLSPMASHLLHGLPVTKLPVASKSRLAKALEADRPVRIIAVKQVA